MPCWKKHPGLCVDDPCFKAVMKIAKLLYSADELNEVYKLVGDLGGVHQELFVACGVKRLSPCIAVFAQAYAIEHDDEVVILNFGTDDAFTFFSAHGLVKRFFLQPDGCRGLIVARLQVRVIGPSPSRMQVLNVEEAKDVFSKVRVSKPEDKQAEGPEDEMAARLGRGFHAMSDCHARSGAAGHAKTRSGACQGFVDAVGHAETGKSRVKPDEGEIHTGPGGSGDRDDDGNSWSENDDGMCEDDQEISAESDEGDRHLDGLLMPLQQATPAQAPAPAAVPSCSHAGVSLASSSRLAGPEPEPRARHVARDPRVKRSDASGRQGCCNGCRCFGKAPKDVLLALFSFAPGRYIGGRCIGRPCG